MKWIVDEVIQNYRQVNGYIPGRDMFFRGGVGEGWFQLMMNSKAELVVMLMGSVLADGEFGDGADDELECGKFFSY